MAEIIKEGTFYTFRTTCPFCGKPAEVKNLRKRALERWNMGLGAFVQDAFPDLSASDREILHTGICGECWATLPPED